MAIYHVTVGNVSAKNANVVPDEADFPRYRAIAGRYSGMGWTAGQAMDDLMAKLEPLTEKPQTIILHRMESDEFFGAKQQERLQELMQRHKGEGLPASEQAELETLIEEELEGAIQRTKKMFGMNQP